MTPTLTHIGALDIREEYILSLPPQLQPAYRKVVAAALSQFMERRAEALLKNPRAFRLRLEANQRAQAKRAAAREAEVAAEERRRKERERKRRWRASKRKGAAEIPPRHAPAKPYRCLPIQS